LFGSSAGFAALAFYLGAMEKSRTSFNFLGGGVNSLGNSPIWIAALEIVVCNDRLAPETCEWIQVGQTESIAQEPGDCVNRSSYANIREAWPWQDKAVVGDRSSGSDMGHGILL
jgi:hypothetical protein